MKHLKNSSLILVIISSIGIVLSQCLMLLGSSLPYEKLNGVSFIGLGLGAILFGTYMLIKGKK